MNFKSTLFIAALGASLSVFGQELINGRGCGTGLPPEGWDEAFNKKVEEFVQVRIAGKTQNTTYVIPVIVHVIYGTQAKGTFPNLSEVQIKSQIDVLNEDFAGIGLNSGNAQSTVFANLVANTDISYCLAQLDPQGNPLSEPGIDRLSYTALGFTNPSSASYNTSTSFQNYMDGTIKPATIWDPTRYLNIWISDRSNATGLLGYATFPALSGLTGIGGSTGTNSTDGVWVWSRAFGNTGVLSFPNNKGRTASHEIGHWLGLRHISGDQVCGNDYCNDTPTQRGGYGSSQTPGLNYSCPSYPYLASNECTGNNSATNVGSEMFMNFMDYVDDACMYMFTPDQTARMQTAMTNGTYRKHLAASSATMCGASLAAPTVTFGVTGSSCMDSLLEISNQSTGMPSPAYQWSSSDNSIVSFDPNTSAATPTISFSAVGTYTITLEATNSQGTNSFSQIITVDYCGADVGIAKISSLNKTINLVPNPSSGIVSISTTLRESKDIQVELYNSLGQLLLTKKYNHISNATLSLDLSAYPNGVYNVSLTAGDDKVNKRLILNK